MRFYEVLPQRLFMSGSFKRETYSAKLSALEQYGIDVVLCTLRKTDPDMSRWATSSKLERQYINHPLSDGQVVPVECYKFVASEVARHINTGQCVLVHCIAGRNRSGLVCGLVVRQIQRVSGADALEIVRRVRPSALVNPVFEQYLRSLPKP